MLRYVDRNLHFKPLKKYSSVQKGNTLHDGTNFSYVNNLLKMSSDALWNLKFAIS